MQCDPRTTERCYNVTEAFLHEHKDIMVENVRLKAALKDCHGQK